MCQAQHKKAAITNEQKSKLNNEHTGITQW